MRFGRVSSALVLALVSVVSVCACGGKAKPPAAAGDSTKPAESFAEVNPADLAELDAGSKSDAGSASATPAPSATPATPEVKDECTPVGVDFEKRARPKLKDCYAAGKKKDANLEGTIKLAVVIDGVGKVKGIKITEKTLPETVAQCMLKVLKATPLPEASKCPSKTLTIPMTFPTAR